jgi:hypothetical protein
VAAVDIGPGQTLIERALERGLEDLWEDLVLAQYLDGELDRVEAIERVGRTKVERADREREVVEEDVDWGLILITLTVYRRSPPPLTAIGGKRRE